MARAKNFKGFQAEITFKKANLSINPNAVELCSIKTPMVKAKITWLNDIVSPINQ